MSNLDFQAVELFNSIKDQYQRQIKLLTSLKQEVTRSEKLDQGQKSALRIQIESILIDINEEIFAISEELSAAFQMTKTEQSSKELLHKAREFEQKKVSLLSKIKQSISNNPSTLLIKSDFEMDSTGLSPPSKQSNLMEMIRKYSNSNERLKQQNIKQDYLNIRQNHESIETFGNINSPTQNFQTKNKVGRKSPSPVPLRNRSNINLNLETPNLQNKRSTSRNKNKSSKIAGDNRSSHRSISRQNLSTKKALNQLYSMKKPKNKRNIPKMLPKFSGCGPGGINGSLMVLNRDSSDAGLTMDSRKNNMTTNQSLQTINSYRDLNQKQMILQKADQNLAKARRETHMINNRPNSSQTRQRSSSVLSTHEDQKHNQSMMASFENSFSKRKEPISLKNEKLPEPKLTETSEAVVQFSRDFDLMRKKFGEMHTNMSQYQENIQTLNKQVSQLNHENLKLNSDIKVIRNEHSEMLHTVYKLEQKNQMLVRENDDLKSNQIELPRQRNFQQIIESPFSSVMQKRQYQEKTGAFPTVYNSKEELYTNTPSIKSPEKIITLFNKEAEVKNENEEELSDWVLQRLQGLKA